MIKYIRKIILFSLILNILFVNTYFVKADEVNSSELSCTSAILIENDTGKVLYEKDADKKIFPASTTKVMTALIAIERLDLEKSITVPKDFPLVDGSSMYLLPDETFTVKELLQGLLVHSANDASVLLGINIAGSESKFVELMNERAKQLGAVNTHFANPHGLHDENHYSTARDMTIIAREAMKNDFFRKTVSMSALSLNETKQTKEKRMYNNTNRFLWSNSQIIYKNKYIPIKYEIIDGIKTGYTNEAGNCLISSGVKNGMRLISAVYKSSGFEMYRDSRIILDYGFENYRFENIIKAGEKIGSEDIKFSIQKTLDYAVVENISNIVKIGEDVKLDKKIDLDDIKLPIRKGDKVGVFTVSSQNESKQYDIVALNDVETIFSVDYIKSVLLNKELSLEKIVIFSGAIVLLLIIIFIINSTGSRKRKRRRRRRYRNRY